MGKVLCLLLFLAACSQGEVARQRSSRPRAKRAAPAVKDTKVVDHPVVVEAIQVDVKLLRKLREKNVVVLDVRDVNDYINGHVKGARHVDILKDDFERRVAKLDRSKKYLLYCDTGGRSGKAIHYFTSHKLRVETIGTYQDLKNRGVPVEVLRD